MNREIFLFLNVAVVGRKPEIKDRARKSKNMIVYIKQEHKQKYINEELNNGYKIRIRKNYFISYLGKNSKKISLERIHNVYYVF